MRKIAVVTGTRAEYGYLRPLMKAIEDDSELELISIVTGMHLLPEFGNTSELVEMDFSHVVRIPMNLKGDRLKDMALYLASGITNFAEFFTQNPPDVLVVLGDRSEPLAAVLAALYLNIPIAHINGGDVTGTTIDESIRHAITKFSHIHFAHTERNAKRIKKMGEDENRIFAVGALTIDTIVHTKLIPKQEIFKKYQLDPTETTFLVVQHPITTLEDRGYSQLKELLSALDTLKKQAIILYPNCDAGSKKFIDLIEKQRGKPYLHIMKNLSHVEYLSFMKSIDVMIGNSSSGIIEAPSFKIPVVNVGTRQQGRERSDNIVDVEPDRNKILKAIDFALHDKGFLKKVKKCKNKFGDGAASKKIVKILKDIKIDKKLIQKQITY